MQYSLIDISSIVLITRQVHLIIYSLLLYSLLLYSLSLCSSLNEQITQVSRSSSWQRWFISIIVTNQLIRERCRKRLFQWSKSRGIANLYLVGWFVSHLIENLESRSNKTNEPMIGYLSSNSHTQKKKWNDFTEISNLPFRCKWYA